MFPQRFARFISFQVLGLKGNPLGHEVLSIYAEPNGTRKLLEFMLDSLHGRMSFLGHFGGQDGPILFIFGRQVP